MAFLAGAEKQTISNRFSTKMTESDKPSAEVRLWVQSQSLKLTGLTSLMVKVHSTNILWIFVGRAPFGNSMRYFNHLTKVESEKKNRQAITDRVTQDDGGIYQ